MVFSLMILIYIYSKVRHGYPPLLFLVTTEPLTCDMTHSQINIWLTQGKTYL